MKKTYGRKFFRSEFPLDEMRTEHAQVTHEIKWAMRNNAYYRNYLACHVPTTCGFLPICETGVVSEEMFDMKPKDDIKKEEDWWQIRSGHLPGLRRRSIRFCPSRLPDATGVSIVHEQAPLA